MGVYIYTTAPNRYLTAEVADASGETKVVQIAIFCYAARMSWGDPSRHERLAVGSAVARFKGGKGYPLGVYGDLETRTVQWDNGRSDVLDIAGTADRGDDGTYAVFYDSTVRSAHLRITRIIQMPKGWKSRSSKQELYDKVMRGEMITRTEGLGKSPMIDFSLFKSGDRFVMVKQGGSSHILNIAYTDADRLWAHWEGFRETTLMVANQVASAA